MMPRVLQLRSLMGRASWAGVVGLALAAPAAARPPDDPIAASNRLTEPWVAPGVKPAAAEAPAPAVEQPMPPVPPGKALLERITTPILPTDGAVTIEKPIPVPTKPISATPTIQKPILAPIMPNVEAPPTVNWSAPVRRPIANILPKADRPMMPCEPAVVAPVAAPPMPPVPPLGPLPPPRTLVPEGGEPQTATPPPPRRSQAVPDNEFHSPTMTATTPVDDPPAKSVTMVRFLDDPSTPRPAGEDTVLVAVLRRGGAAVGTAADIRAAVERACHDKVVACQTEVAGERQVRVTLAVHTADDWQRLYDRLQNLPELGEYGLLFEVRVEK